MRLQDKLEQLKEMGVYAVNLTYGEDVGCDDLDVLQNKRRLIVIFSPVGCLGEARIMYYGNLGDFLSFNLKTKPTMLSNPPDRSEYIDGGYFIWGTENSVENILEKPFHGKWE